MAAEIVHDHDVAWLEVWHEDLLDIGEEALAVDRTIEDARRIEAIMAKPIPKAFARGRTP